MFMDNIQLKQLEIHDTYSYFDIPSSPDCRDNTLKAYRDCSRTCLVEMLCRVFGEAKIIIDGGNNLMTIVARIT